MAEPFIFIGTSAVKEGKLEEYRKHFQDVVNLVDEREPRMVHFALYVNADGTEESTVQVHRDAENMAFHMGLIADHVQQARDYLDFSKMNIQIYGTPTEDVVDQMRQLAGSGVPVTIKTPVTGFDRIG